mmetsp:Transcript_52778/g.123445  ORF Transcript_52778/g.123445 Transcript_52778/m.123445 type:complete len:245 (+) Transcript_52778:103-837(+)
MWPDFWPAMPDATAMQGPSSRRSIGDGRAVGMLVDWQDKGVRSHGWIAPLHGIPSGLPEAKGHGGDIYIHWQDVLDPRTGSIVTFSAYLDDDGLGAEDCRNRQVLRFVLPYQAVEKLEMPKEEVSYCATYLSASVFYPEMEEDGITLRRYVWDGSLTLLELWGNKDDIICSVEKLGLTALPDAEALISRHVASILPKSEVREIAEAELPNVPPRFRLGWALFRAAGDDMVAARGKLQMLLDMFA